MAARKLIALAAVSALGLAACDNQARHGDARLCTPFPGQSAAAANGGAAATVPQPTDPASAMDDCVHRWSYALAAAPDPAEQVAGAAVAACSSVLARWNQQAITPAPLAPGQPAESGGAVEAPSLLTGETTTAAGEHYAYAQRRALFYVVQGRAGKCAAPALPQATSGNP